ncbi:unnamed protein product [Medioppia subpectinata]|uniref:Uncharacterized protein n=1 Tax=Medioppia subpectinata TaxID=1979941 RepID=A0A7R9QKL1_9ACAR|nr:unnamed protein product [Medioppia subpectinata]CAG2121905.1 unnamed protein product [Medioppia subpectinata]
MVSKQYTARCMGARERGGREQNEISARLDDTSREFGKTD